MAGIAVNIVTSEKYKRKRKKKYPASTLIIFYYKDSFSPPQTILASGKLYFSFKNWLSLVLLMAEIGVIRVTSEKYKRKRKKNPASTLIIFYYKNSFSLPPDNSCDQKIVFIFQKWDTTCLVNGRD